jgi:2-dehydro-3-deoxygluconokinase
LLKPEDFDFDQIFEEHNVGWAHSGGIFSALSESTAKVVLAFVKKAREKGIITSFDLNYRNLLWALQGGTEGAQRVLREIVEYVDVLVGNEEDLQLSLGLKGPAVGKKDAMDVTVFRDLVGQVNRLYPGVQAVATTLRHVRSRNRHDWGAALWLKNGCWGTTDGSGASTSEEYFEAPKMDLDVLDRIGGGDGFATALFYSLIKRQVPVWACDEGGNPWSFGDYCVRMGAAHGALLTSTKGDTTGVKLSDVVHLARGGSARVAR